MQDSSFIPGLVLICILAAFTGLSVLAGRKPPLPSVCAGPDDCSECPQQDDCEYKKRS